MIKRNVHVSEQQNKRLKDLSSKTGLSVSELIRRAIDNYSSYKNVSHNNE